MLVVIIGTFGFDLKCDFEARRWKYLNSNITCIVSDLNITTSVEAATSMNGNTEPRNEVFGIWIIRQQVSHFPLGLEKFLPNLQGILIEHSKLQTIKQSDLKPFGNLTVLNLEHNEIEVIPDDLFAFNPKLKEIVFNYSPKLKAVGRNAIPIGVESAHFEFAGCIDSFMYGAEDMSSLQTKIQQSCLTPDAEVKN